MTERIATGIEVNFCDLCPYLKKNGVSRPVRLFFSADDPDIIASETGCPNGGLPGIEKRSDSGFLVPLNQDSIVAYCNGCPKLKAGFEKKVE